MKIQVGWHWPHWPLCDVTKNWRVTIEPQNVALLIGRLGERLRMGQTALAILLFQFIVNVVDIL